jgi:hypothetical protein
VTLLCYLSLYFKLYKLNLKRLPTIELPNARIKIEKEIEGLKLKLKKTLDLYDLWLRNNTRFGVYAFI